MRLSDFRALSFDCYGTLIDWETGIWEALAPLRSHGEASSGGRNRSFARDRALEAFARLEPQVQEEWPGALYPEVLTEVHRRLASEWAMETNSSLDRLFGESVASWPPFPDTVEALGDLASHYRLIVLSNVDRRSFAATEEELGTRFDAVYTAEDIGSYKPDPANFRYLLDHAHQDLNMRPRDILHVAQSLFHDHVPAKAAGLASAWIDRKGGQGGATARVSERPVVDFRFTDLATMARARRAEQET